VWFWPFFWLDARTKIETDENVQMKDTTQDRIVGRLGLLPEVSTSNEAALSLSMWAPPAVASRAVRNR
jgi:hypothetical protein